MLITLAQPRFPLLEREDLRKRNSCPSKIAHLWFASIVKGHLYVDPIPHKGCSEMGNLQKKLKSIYAVYIQQLHTVNIPSSSTISWRKKTSRGSDMDR